jgi:hypothetical protein
MLALLLPGTVFGQGRPTVVPPDGQSTLPVIFSATVNSDLIESVLPGVPDCPKNQCIIITGQNFGVPPDPSPLVNISGNIMLTVDSFDNQKIYARLPADFSAGTYLLNVTVNNNMTSASDVTIGSRMQFISATVDFLTSPPTIEIKGRNFGDPALVDRPEVELNGVKIPVEDFLPSSDPNDPTDIQILRASTIGLLSDGTYPMTVTSNNAPLIGNQEKETGTFDVTIGATGPQGAKGLNWRGAWSPTTSYQTDDAVSYVGSSWIAKQGSTGSTPIEGLDWTLVAQKGDTAIIPDLSNYARLDVPNSFAGNQSVTGSVSAASFAGDGLLVTNVNAAKLGGETLGAFAKLSAANSFTGDQSITGNQSVTGSVSAVSFIGDGALVTGVNADKLLGKSLDAFARLDVANSFIGDQTITGKVGIGAIVPGSDFSVAKDISDGYVISSIRNFNHNGSAFLGLNVPTLGSENSGFNISFYGNEWPLTRTSDAGTPLAGNTLFGGSATSTKFIFNPGSAGDYRFEIGNAEKLRIDAGSVNISDALAVGGNLSIGGSLVGTIKGTRLEVGGTTGEANLSIYGFHDTGIGVFGNSGNVGVKGEGLTGVDGFGNDTGVSGRSTNNIGVLGVSGSGDGVRGVSTTGLAGNFLGNVSISGDLAVGGALSKASGSFKINHPLDSANKYLYHSFVESPDMMNIYNGIALLDEDGRAVVTLPEWFEALNKDFRYQLTAVGAPGPELYIAREIKSNTFEIAGGKPGLKVSWEVTGIRQDAYANAHRVPVEEDKAAHERGTYLYPELFQ